jgi:RNA polymerase sigma-70 factor (ECF subfamily)
MDPRAEITVLLGDIRRGNKEAVNQLLPLVYNELRRLARAQFRRERRAHTLQPSALVHEAYLHLVGQRTPLESRNHFLALAATQMRRILLDYARKYRRRAGSGERVSIDDAVAIQQPRPVDVITLDAALTKLATLDPTQAQLVELRFFGGLSLEETAEAMGVSTATVKRSWNSARAFLRREMERGVRDTGAVGSDPANL